MTPLPALSDVKSALHDLQQRFDLMSQSEAQETDLHLAWRAAAEAAEARVSALTAENAKLNKRLGYMHGVHQSCGDALSTEMHKVSALTAERDDLADELASCEFCSRPFEAQREGGTIPCRIACCTDCWNSQHNVHLRADIERLTAEREALQAQLQVIHTKPCGSRHPLPDRWWCERGEGHDGPHAAFIWSPKEPCIEWTDPDPLAGAPHAPTQEKP